MFFFLHVVNLYLYLCSLSARFFIINNDIIILRHNYLCIFRLGFLCSLFALCTFCFVCSDCVMSSFIISCVRRVRFS